MSQEELKAKIQWAIEEAYRGNLDALEQIYAPNCRFWRPPFPEVTGVESMKQQIDGIRQAYSDIQTTWHEWVAEGNTIIYRTTIRLKHTGVSQSLPIPPTGKQLTLESCTVAHVAHSKVVEEFEYSDYLSFLQQLGIVPPLG